MAGRTFGFILRIGISLAILLLSSCARKTDGTRVQTYTDDELRQLRTEFDIYENILGRYDSFSLSAVDSILPLAKKYWIIHKMHLRKNRHINRHAITPHAHTFTLQKMTWEMPSTCWTKV